ncbi:MAG: hypothetical protein LBF16_00725, partial [Pseudomonadales bacterium]|nr:hypothetical protein [Pseudomonadales bacterium]
MSKHITKQEAEHETEHETERETEHDNDFIELIEAGFDEVAARMVASASSAAFLKQALPLAKWRGWVELGGEVWDCCVLDTEQRVLWLPGVGKARTNADGDGYGKGLLPDLFRHQENEDETQLVAFVLPENPDTCYGLTSEQFERICRKGVQALQQGVNLTEREHIVALKCAMIAANLTRAGLDVLID